MGPAIIQRSILSMPLRFDEKYKLQSSSGFIGLNDKMQCKPRFELTGTQSIESKR